MLADFHNSLISRKFAVRSQTLRQTVGFVSNLRTSQYSAICDSFFSCLLCLYFFSAIQGNKLDTEMSRIQHIVVLCCFIRCLAKFGIYPSETLGADDRLRFHSDNPVTLLNGNQQHAKYYYFTLDDVSIGNPKVRRSSGKPRGFLFFIYSK